MKRRFEFSATLLTLVVIGLFTAGFLFLEQRPVVPALAAGDFKTQIVKITIPASSSSTTATAPTDFDAVTTTSTIALISGVTQHALGRVESVNQLADETSVLVELTNSTTITATRSFAGADPTTVWVLLIEYTGAASGANEFIVRSRSGISWSNGQTSKNIAPPINSISDTNDVVVFNNGQINPGSSAAVYDRGDIRAYIAGNKRLQLSRGDGTDSLTSGHQVVEFTGSNWTIQTGDATPAQDTGGTDVSVTAVSSINDVWVYYNWDTNLPNLDERGHRLWLTSTTNLRVQEHANATGTKNIRWYLIENPEINVQTGAADNQFQNDLSNTITGFTAVSTLENSFAWVHGMTNGGGNAHPRDMWQFELSDASTISLERGYSGQNLDYRYYVVELPTGFVPELDQIHYHWRNDDGSESAATSATGGSEDTVLNNAVKQSTYRLRVEVSNEDLGISSPVNYRLEYASKAATCAASTGWTDVGAVGGIFDMSDSTNLTDGSNTTNIAEAIGGVTDENTTFETPNAAVKDTSSQTAAITLGGTEFVEIEYAIEATTSATPLSTYCFRVTDAGTPIDTYTVYPEITIESQALNVGEYGTVTLTGSGSQVVNLTNDYSDMIVVASPRYAPTSNVQRMTRIISKTNGASASFTIKVDNAAGSLTTESTTVDYIVMEAGVHTIVQGTGTRQVIAGSENVSGVFCNNNSTSGSGTTISFSPAFSSAPAVLHTVTSNNDTNWTASMIDNNASFLTPPTTTTARLWLMRNFESCTHSAEDIDYIAFEEGFGTNNGVEMDAVVGPDTTACCNASGYAIPFNSTFSAAPAVGVISQMAMDGANGGYAVKHTGTANTTTNYYGSIDEDGTSADRTHTNEQAAVVAFNASSGNIVTEFTYSQQGYRVFNNNNSTDVGTPLAAQNTAATLSAAGAQFRLRLLMDMNSTFPLNGDQDFKLQFAEQSGTCDTSFTGETYADVTDTSLIAYFDNAAPSDGDTLTSNANDPTLSGTDRIQTYNDADESGSGNVFNNAVRAIPLGDDGLWDFALEDNGASSDTNYCLRIVKDDGGLLDTYTIVFEIQTSAGTLSIDIVDAGGIPVGSPSLSLSPLQVAFVFQNSNGTLGVSAERIRVDNGTTNPQWTASIAADLGATAFWDGPASADYDFNDPTASAGDGGDTDSFGGQMTIDPSGATITPDGGCSSTGLTLGSSTSFSEGVTDSITLISAGVSADTTCFWDITDIDIDQTIPAEQETGTYNIDMTLSIVAI